MCLVYTTLNQRKQASALMLTWLLGGNLTAQDTFEFGREEDNAPTPIAYVHF